MDGFFDTVNKIFEQPIFSRHDLLFLIICSTIIYFLKVILDHTVSIPLAKKFKISDKGSKKFIENIWYILYYSISLVIGYFVLRGKPFFPWTATRYFDFPVFQDWIDYPEMKFYYLAQTSFYIQASFALVKKKISFFFFFFTF